MLGSIGKQLGTLLAQHEESLFRDGSDEKALACVSLISEAYKNFSTAALAGFEEDFSAGYSEELSELRGESRPRPDRGALLSAYDSLPQNDGC